MMSIRGTSTSPDEESQRIVWRPKEIIRKLGTDGTDPIFPVSIRQEADFS